MTIAISFDGHSLETEQPIGIAVATREFIRAHFRYSRQDKYYCVCPTLDAFNLYKNYGQEENIKEENCISINQNDPEGLKKAQCLLRYDPGIVRNAWARRYQGQRLYSVCGVAHSSASATAMEMMGSYISSPLQSWDALICPSRAIHSAIHSIIASWENHFKERFKVELKCPLELPVIPLGVDSARFAKYASRKNRTQQRNLLGISENEMVILYVGRLNYIAKANPLALLIAAEEAAKGSIKPIRILFYGYFNDKTNEEAFNQAVNIICEKVNVTVVKHGTSNLSEGVWAAGDIFCSLSDSLQESFGLTPIEAMAAGLPVIVSDWNGYKETVRDGLEGIKIPTYMPTPGAGSEIAYHYFSGQFSYGDYLGATSQSIAVDIPSLTKAISAFSKNPEMVRAMGKAGTKRASGHFDWSHIISAYGELWKELDLRRRHQTELTPLLDGGFFHPSHQDPFSMFSDFPTTTISLKGSVSLLVKNWPEALKRISLKMGLIIPNTLLELDKLGALIAQIEEQPTSTLEKIALALGETNQPRFTLTICWLLKLGICQYYPPDEDHQR